MTDPIRIPNVAVFEDSGGTKYRQITSYAEVTPKIQAQILAPLAARLAALEKHYHHLKPGR
jgi:hypothetical protein